MRFYLISDNVDTLVGMRLAGIEGVVAHEDAEVQQALDEVLKADDIGMILVTEKLMRQFGEHFDQVRQTMTKPPNCGNSRPAWCRKRKRPHYQICA